MNTVISRASVANRNRAISGRQVVAGTLVLLFAVGSAAGCTNVGDTTSADHDIYVTYQPGDINHDGQIDAADGDLMSPEQFWELDLVSRLTLRGEMLVKDKPEAYRIYQKYLRPDERQVMSLPDLNSLPTWSAQDYLNNYSVGLYLASIQEPTQEGTNDGRKLWSIVADPDSPGFKKTSEMIGNNPGVSNVYRAIPTGFKGDLGGQAEFMGHAISDLGGYLAYGEYVANGDRQYMLFVNFPGPGGTKHSLLMDIYTGNEPGFRSSVATLPG